MNSKKLSGEIIKDYSDLENLIMKDSEKSQDNYLKALEEILTPYSIEDLRFFAIKFLFKYSFSHNVQKDDFILTHQYTLIEKLTSAKDKKDILALIRDTIMIFKVSDSTDKHLIKSALEIMSNKITEHITLDSVASELFISKYHLCRIFKKTLGKTFGEILMEKKLIIAKDRLLNSKASMVEIALDLGIENPCYFSAIFKKHVGITPREFRNKSLED